MSAFKEGDPTTLNRLYGRSQGKPLRAAQQELVDKLLPQISVPSEGPVTSEALFGFERPLHFEIGFGGGEPPPRHLTPRQSILRPTHPAPCQSPSSVFCVQKYNHTNCGK